ncbi:MAG: TRAP transporter large permease subunit [Gammaproteobacteria bacterium]|nr:TRAP transporter large permease subunit [Gammaproteobacteria bacterium]
MVLALIVLAILGAPLFIVIATNAFWGYHQAGIDLQIVAIEFYSIAETPILLAIPLFALAGYLLSESEAPARLVRFTNAVLGWMPGGLAVVTIITSVLFSAFTGVSGVNIIALGALLYPALLQANYKDRFSLGLVTTSGSIGLLFAPSLPLILYGVIAKQPVDDLFLAGLLPGILFISVLSLYGIWQAPKASRKIEDWSWPEVWGAIKESAWEIPLPFVVLGGIYSGVLAVSDAAVVTLVYVFIVEVLIRREIAWRTLPRIIREAMILVGAILMIIGVSFASTNVMIDQGIPQKLLASITGWVTDRTTFIVLLLLFFLVLGAIVDIFSAVVLVVPLLLPVAQEFGIHPIHLGIMFMAAMELGYTTPPVGLNLFISAYRFDRSILSVYRATLPFFFIELVVVLIILFWPDLSLWLIGEN